MYKNGRIVAGCHQLRHTFHFLVRLACPPLFKYVTFASKLKQSSKNLMKQTLEEAQGKARSDTNYELCQMIDRNMIER